MFFYMVHDYVTMTNKNEKKQKKTKSTIFNSNTDLDTESAICQIHTFWDAEITYAQ